MENTTTCYKLTSQALTTYGDFIWIEGEWTTPLPGKGKLCSGSWYHAYHHPLLALFLNPIHADFKQPILWEAEGRGAFQDDNGLKCGFASMRLVKRLEIPEITTEQRVRFALLCAKEVYKETSFVEFADKYLFGEDRSQKTAARAARSAAEAAWSAAWSAARSAESAAWSAAEAAAEWAARAAESAAREAANQMDSLPRLIKAAEEAMRLPQSTENKEA